MKTLVSLSGGIDSTYLLWKLLSTTQNEITALNVDISTSDPNYWMKYDIRGFSKKDGEESQLDKVNSIVAWLKANVRDFTLVREPLMAIYLSKDLHFPNNPQSYSIRYALPRINNGTMDKVCLSCEWENDGFSDGGTVGLNRSQGSWTALEIFKSGATRGSLEFTLLDMDYNQAYALSEMPKELIDLCRYPLKFTQWETAKVSWFKGQLNQGKTPAEAGAIAKAKCTLPDGKWFTMKAWVLGQEPNSSNTWNMPTWPSSYEVPSSG
jgi:hypothetical protein